MDGEVEEIINGVNERIFLPGLQREFVWNPDQIESLFDSLIREYPVGITTIWKTQTGAIKNYTTYNFLSSHVSSDHYPPKEIRDEFERYNDEAKGRDAELLVIDGQQRLNSIYFGVRGKITEYTGGQGRKSSEAKNWASKKLCVNLFGHPRYDYDIVYGDYQFEFRSTGELGDKNNFGYQETGGEHRLWVPVERFWSSSNRGNGFVISDDKLLPDVISPFLERASIAKKVVKNNDLRYIAESVGRNVRSNILDAELKTKNIKKSRSDIPEIFQRLNREGKRPESYQLFLSRLITRWPYLENDNDINPRKKIEDWVDEFKREFSAYEEYITRKLFIRYSLGLIDTDLTQSGVGTTSGDDFDRLREMWTSTEHTSDINQYKWFTKSLKKSFRTIMQSGVRPELFNTMPFFVLIGVFYYRNPTATVDKNINRVFRFISKLLLSSQVGNRALGYGTYRSMRRFLFREGSGQNYDQFPGDTMLNKEGFILSNSDIRSAVRNSRYNDPANTGMFKNKSIIAILGVIEESYTTGFDQDIGNYEIDHIYPRGKKDVISESTTENFDLDRVGNLQLLPKQTNRSKGDKLPSKWFDEQPDVKKLQVKQMNQYPEVKPKKENVAKFIQKVVG